MLCSIIIITVEVSTRISHTCSWNAPSLPSSWVSLWFLCIWLFSLSGMVWKYGTLFHMAIVDGWHSELFYWSVVLYLQSIGLFEISSSIRALHRTQLSFFWFFAASVFESFTNNKYCSSSLLNTGSQETCSLAHKQNIRGLWVWLELIAALQYGVYSSVSLCLYYSVWLCDLPLVHQQVLVQYFEFWWVKC